MKAVRFFVLVTASSLALLLSACGGSENTPVVVTGPNQATPATATSEVTPMPTPSLPAGGVSPALVDKAKAFVDLLAKEDFATAEQEFDQTMKQQLPEAKLAETWKGLLGQVGAFKEQIGTRTAQAQGYDIVFVTCAFENANIDVRVVFDKDQKIAGLFFSAAAEGTPTPAGGASGAPTPSYVKQDSFTETEVRVGSGEWVLPGTLTMPRGDGPFPAVVLVHGSGPQDRDETIGPNKPFRDIAWGLASQGIAVLRYEKRTKAYQQQMAAISNTITLDLETVDDALAAVSLLRNTEKIDHNRIFVLGHSLGGTAAPKIGQRDPGIAGLIIMAGGTKPIEDAVLDQYTYIFSLNGTPTADQQKQLDELKAKVAKAKSPDLTKDTPASELPLSMPAAYLLDLRNYHATEVAKTLSQPMLILQGEADYQVTLEEFQGWKDALQSKSNVEFKSYPHVYHLFIEIPGTRSTPNDYVIPGHVAPQVIDDIATWVKQH